MPPTRIDLAYAAGLFDGEGWFHINKGKRKEVRRGYSFQIHAQMTLRERDRHLLDWFMTMFDGSVCRQAAETETRAAYFRWTATGEGAARFAHEIKPYLRLKTAHADLAQEFQRLKRQQGNKPLADERYDEYQSMYDRMKILNRRGPLGVTD